MKSESRKNFTVRLNLNKPSHLAAWRKLQSDSQSRTEAIVAALTGTIPSIPLIPDEDRLKSLMKQAVTEALRDLPAGSMPVSATTESSSMSEISDEDFDIAEAFMSSLCG